MLSRGENSREVALLRPHDADIGASQSPGWCSSSDGPRVLTIQEASRFPNPCLPSSLEMQGHEHLVG